MGHPHLTLQLYVGGNGKRENIEIKWKREREKLRIRIVEEVRSQKWTPALPSALSLSLSSNTHHHLPFLWLKNSQVCSYRWFSIPLNDKKLYFSKLMFDQKVEIQLRKNQVSQRVKHPFMTMNRYMKKMKRRRKGMIRHQWALKCHNWPLINFSMLLHLHSVCMRVS